MLPQFDPTKMDPKVLMQLSQLIQQLPAEQLTRMQTLMHNTMAGFDVRREMEEFERNLPPGFREKMMALVAANPQAFAQGMQAMASPTPPQQQSPHAEPLSGDMDLHQARLTILRGVASGEVTPEDAERLLFNA